VKIPKKGGRIPRRPQRDSSSVQRFCPPDASGLDIEQVATGEHWYGVQALEKGLVDAVETSDELLLGLMESTR
jgi:hypothetical protein